MVVFSPRHMTALEKWLAFFVELPGVPRDFAKLFHFFDRVKYLASSVKALVIIAPIFSSV